MKHPQKAKTNIKQETQLVNLTKVSFEPLACLLLIIIKELKNYPCLHILEKGLERQ